MARISKKLTPITYQITSHDVGGHYFHVEMRISHPKQVHQSGQIVSLPVWIPGSYMVREFAKNIVQIHAHCAGKKIELRKLDKTTWQAAPCQGELEISYQIYAWDLSVRTAHLDAQHGFFNGTSVFLQAQGFEHEPHHVKIVCPSQAPHWKLATTLPRDSRMAKSKTAFSFGDFQAANYDELIDHPVEMGNFQSLSFQAHGVKHDVIFTGKVPRLDVERISQDLQKICEKQVAFFEPQSKQAPFDHYLFMVMVVDEGFGGLEHRSSTALICSRKDLPTLSQKKQARSENYVQFLGLCSHEYFHSWHVKRIKPQVFAPYDLHQENYTQLLWLFEGFTSYYDDLFLRRADMISETQYLAMLAKTLNAVEAGAGRLKQSVAESSFDAWTKYYRQDENAPNAIVSYYAKGSLVALGLDLLIRKTTSGKKSLDDVMRYLWVTLGKDFYSTSSPQGVPESINALNEIILVATGVEVASFLKRYVYACVDVPIVSWLSEFGIEVKNQNLKNAKQGKEVTLNLGMKLTSSGADCKIAQVFENSCAHQAGLSAGDVLVAVNQLRVQARDASNQLANLLYPYQEGETVLLYVFRRDELLEISLRLKHFVVPAYQFSVAQTKSEIQVNKGKGKTKTKTLSKTKKTLFPHRPFA